MPFSTGGAVGGAATGATIGSVIPGIGTAIGGAVGGIAGGLSGFLGSHRKTPYYDTLDSRNPNYANNALAYFTRDQYSDWLKRFQGIAAGQIKYATDDTQPGKAADEAGKYVQGSFARIPGQLERLNAREGLTLTPDEQASQQRSIATAGGLADVTARNRAAQQTYDRQNSILTGVQSPATASIRGLQGGQP